MKKIILSLITGVCCFSTSVVYAQQSDQKIEYRRSSLHMVLLESERFPMKDTVIRAYNNMPFPDKYNNHSVADKSFDPTKYVITNEERLAAGNKVSKNDDATTKDIPLQIEKYIQDKKLAKQLVEKWFDRSPKGTFDMKLIQERGFYNASEMDAALSAGKARGLASLGDAGEELIKNTFVVFSKLTFISNELVAKGIQITAIEAANKISNSMLKQAAIKTADATYEKTREGYSVWTNSWLYQLQWNDSVAAIFYNDLWNNKEAFDKSDLFKLELLGSEKSQALVVFSGTKSQEQIVKLATVRNIDNTFAKLQKAFEVFKPKVPVLTIDPITAQIGMKEGLEGGEKFEVLEFIFNAKTGVTEYKSVGKVSVDKKLIWDNRYNAGENVVQEINATSFSSLKKVQPGMLLRQLK